jgi:hypothetical protein
MCYIIVFSFLFMYDRQGYLIIGKPTERNASFSFLVRLFVYKFSDWYVSMHTTLVYRRCFISFAMSWQHVSRPQFSVHKQKTFLCTFRMSNYDGVFHHSSQDVLLFQVGLYKTQSVLYDIRIIGYCWRFFFVSLYLVED